MRRNTHTLFLSFSPPPLSLSLSYSLSFFLLHTLSITRLVTPSCPSFTWLSPSFFPTSGFPTCLIHPPSVWSCHRPLFKGSIVFSLFGWPAHDYKPGLRQTPDHCTDDNNDDGLRGSPDLQESIQIPR